MRITFSGFRPRQNYRQTFIVWLVATAMLSAWPSTITAQLPQIRLSSLFPVGGQVGWAGRRAGRQHLRRRSDRRCRPGRRNRVVVQRPGHHRRPKDHSSCRRKGPRGQYVHRDHRPARSAGCVRRACGRAIRGQQSSEFRGKYAKRVGGNGTERHRRTCHTCRTQLRHQRPLEHGRRCGRVPVPWPTRSTSPRRMPRGRSRLASTGHDRSV